VPLDSKNKRSVQVLGIDAGGTMTDTFFVDADGDFVVGKAQSTPQDESIGLIESSREGLEAWGLDLADVRTHILELDDVVEVHDLHASRIGTGLPVLSAHVVVEEACFVDGRVPAILDALQRCVAEHFEVSVEHSTFQLEPPGHAEHEVQHHD